MEKFAVGGEADSAIHIYIFIYIVSWELRNENVM